MSYYESVLEKASSSCFLIYMMFVLQSRVWLGLSTPLAGVYLTDESWRDADASLTRLKGTTFTVYVLSGADVSHRLELCWEIHGPASLLRLAGHGWRPLCWGVHKPAP